MQKSTFPLFVIAILMAGCKVAEVATATENIPPIELEPVEVKPEEKVYNPSRSKVHDLLHTRLDISFDWQKHHLLGEATLDLRPYFYPSDRLVLDAKGFDIHEVQLVTDSGFVELPFSYDNWKLDIQLDKVYSRIEQYKVRIRYTAKPDDLPVGGSAAILADKGLYFINTDSTEVDKPTQIWTQGQTESSSCWFPTIDSPNERTTQEMLITVEDRFRTLSNGEHVYSNFNDDGTRTDYFKMDEPHPPYLFMMAIGDYVVANDQWENSAGEIIPVTYWVEPEYAPYAYRVFGNTPEMMEFFSNLLDYEYPWPKYSQVVVRDYISGAMENTSATIFGEFMNLDERSLLDSDYEDVISHELFHHWFGDLVTCESWANLPLNESFATYGEYLWREYKFGEDEADFTLANFMIDYFNEAFYDRKHLIRYYYDDKERMFDSHSYQKGGCVLHMLRKYVGDEAFFKGLNFYLNSNEYHDVEIHHLRLAFEEVTGEDLQWFFNQWFLGTGHPELIIEEKWDAATKQLSIEIEQVQQEEAFRIPTQVALHLQSGEQLVHDLDIRKNQQTFTFDCPEQPTWVSIDPTNDQLMEIDQAITAQTAFVQYNEAVDWFDRINAFSIFDEDVLFTASDSLKLYELAFAALQDPHREVQISAMRNIAAVDIDPARTLATLLALTKSEESEVRATAVSVLGEAYAYDDTSVYTNALEDKSYRVMASGLNALVTVDAEAAIDAAKRLQYEPSRSIVRAVANVFAQAGSLEQEPFFTSAFEQKNGYEAYIIIMRYSDFLLRFDAETAMKGIDLLSGHLQSEKRFVALASRRSLTSMMRNYSMALETLSQEEATSPEALELRSLVDRISLELSTLPN